MQALFYNTKLSFLKTFSYFKSPYFITKLSYFNRQI